MDFFRDDLGYSYQCVSEVDFGDMIVEWHNYRCNVPAIKNAGGMYVTAIFDSKTGNLLIKKHYRNDYMRSHCLPKLMDEAKKMIPKED